jgi:hypothetical protein
MIKVVFQTMNLTSYIISQDIEATRDIVISGIAEEGKFILKV